MVLRRLNSCYKKATEELLLLYTGIAKEAILNSKPHCLNLKSAMNQIVNGKRKLSSGCPRCGKVLNIHFLKVP